MKHRVFEAVPNDGAGGGGAPPPATAAPPAAGTPPPAAAAPPPAQASGLGAAAPPAGIDWLQGKYHVKSADGKLDEAASIRKQAEGYASLVTRIGSDELRPDKIEGYTFKPPEGVEPALFDDFVKDADTQNFVKGAHDLGLNNSQLNFVVEQFLKTVPQLMQEDAQARDVQTKAYLKEHMWKDDAAISAGITSAIQVGAKLGLSNTDLTQPLKLGNGVTLPPLINHPLLLKALSSLAGEMREDTAPQGDALPASDLDSLMKSKAYTDPAHPDHLATKQKVTAHFNRAHGGDKKTTGAFTFQT